LLCYLYFEVSQAAASKRSLLSYFEEHPFNSLHYSVKITQDIILAIQLAKKVPFKYRIQCRKKYLGTGKW